MELISAETLRDLMCEAVKVDRTIDFLTGKIAEHLHGFAKKAKDLDAFLNACTTEEEWIKKFVNHGLDIGHTAWPKLDFNFDNLTHFFDWWEGTTIEVIVDGQPAFGVPLPKPLGSFDNPVDRSIVVKHKLEAYLNNNSGVSVSFSIFLDGTIYRDNK